MKKFACVAAALLVISATAMGQDQGRRRGDREGRQGRRGGRGPSLQQMVERMNETLNFDEEQMEQIDKLLEAQSEQSEDRRAQFEEMRKAMDEGDEERAAELREQFRAQREERGGRMQAFLDDVEPILHEDQMEAFGEVRERVTQRDQDRRRRGEQMRMYRQLPDVLEMTDEQREEYRALMDERRAMMRERMQEGRNSDQAPGEQGEGRSERRRPDFESMQAGFFEDLEEILTKDQIAALADYRAEMATESRGDRGQEEPDDLRAMVRASRRIPDLTSEQKDSIREITSAAMRESRQLKSKDKEVKSQLATATKAEIVKLLDEEQTEAFEQNIKRVSSASGQRGVREDRGERGQRGQRGDRPGKKKDIP